MGRELGPAVRARAGTDDSGQSNEPAAPGAARRAPGRGAANGSGPAHARVDGACSDGAVGPGVPGPTARAHSAVVLPPAAAIFSAAEPEKACAFTSTATAMSPEPSTLTGWFFRTAPRATSDSTVTSPPSG